VGGKAPGGTTTLRIWRSDGQNDSNLVINCGANKRASKANIPYYRGPEEGGEKEEDDFIVGILVGVVLVLGTVYLFLKAGGKKAPEARKDGRRGGKRRR